MALYSEFNSSEGFFIAERARRTGAKSVNSEHYHDSYEIYLYLGSEMSHFIGDQSYSMRMHDIMLVDRFVFHRTSYPTTVKNHERILLSFDANTLGLICDDATMAQVAALFTLRKLQFINPTDQQAAVESIIRLHKSFGAEASQVSRLRCRFQLCELVLSLAELMEKGLLASSTAPLTSVEKRVADVIAYLNVNYTDYVGLDMLSREFFVSKFTLCHEFKKTTGMTVVQYVNHRRLAEAARLLKDPVATVMEVSQVVGFNSLSHFNKLFRSFYGCSPSGYRAQMHV